MKSQNVVLHRHFVKQDCEDPFLHFSGVLGAKNDHFFFGKVNCDRGSRGHSGGESICWKRTSIVYGVVWVEVDQLFPRGTDEHVAHEESMVGSSTHDTDIDSISFVPASKAINNVDAVSGVQIVDGSFTIDFPDLVAR